MTEILDRILDIHNDPKLFITGAQIKDSELNIPILGKHIDEDNDGWFIRHNGQVILYCAKRSTENPEFVGIKNLEAVLAETWGRYTRKRLNPELNLGWEV